MITVFHVDGFSTGSVLPPVPFPLTRTNAPITQADPGYTSDTLESTDEPATAHSPIGTPMCMPVWLKATNGQEDWWLIPMEPLITLGGGNTLVRRNVAKSALRGTIKERWNTDDYGITIEGVITRIDDLRFPNEDVIKLRTLLESRDTLDIKCPVLSDVYGITRIAVERFDFPFTKGPENQAYRITGYSDDNWTLFIDPLK